MLYLTRWRIQLAASRLAAGTAPVGAVAGDVGFESEAAFCRAFKKVIRGDRAHCDRADVDPSKHPMEFSALRREAQPQLNRAGHQCNDAGRDVQEQPPAARPVGTEPEF